jgi:orotidine-5'-phosphate decarboxylase
MSAPFGQRLAEAVAARQSNLVLGLDPDPQRLWPDALRAAGDGAAEQQLARAVLSHCHLVLDAVAPAAVAVKVQVASFERLGTQGAPCSARSASTPAPAACSCSRTPSAATST